MNICTWNSQGDPTTDPFKADILASLAKKNHVLLLQECGRLSRIGNILPGWYYALAPQAGAFNPRCSTAIVAGGGFTCQTHYLPSGTGRSLMIATFPHIPVQILTMHAESGTGSDVFPVLRNRTGLFILGGDMNCEPSALSDTHGSGTRSIQIDRAGTQAFISSPPSYTHPGSYHTLDYFIYSAGVRCTQTETYHLKGGDHYPVETQVDWG